MARLGRQAPGDKGGVLIPEGEGAHPYQLGWDVPSQEVLQLDLASREHWQGPFQRQAACPPHLVIAPNVASQMNLWRKRK